MDPRRCLAIAFDRFGQQGEERINVPADGKFAASKRFVVENSRDGKLPKRCLIVCCDLRFGLPPETMQVTNSRVCILFFATKHWPP